MLKVLHRVLFKKTLQSALSLTSLTILLSGCSSTADNIYLKQEVENIHRVTSTIENTQSKDFFVGDHVFSINKFKAKAYSDAAIVFSSDFSVKRDVCLSIVSNCSYYVPADRKYEVLRRIQLNDEIYDVVSIDRRSASKLDKTEFAKEDNTLLVGSDGKLLKRVFIANLNEVLPNTFSVNPSSVKGKRVDIIIDETKSDVTSTLLLKNVLDNSISVEYSKYDSASNTQLAKELYELPLNERFIFKEVEMLVTKVGPRSVNVQFFSESDSI
ncbi:hypothetical protein Q5L94_08590 [Idiomarina sp. Sol25]|uniref:hypothetical protein n=1 Tax=Idiomarina sp. Sol25 TaxID=3064000 RepID=UPI00294B3DA7|nr:hypothetical protein [Idiomarina sp. Sol25]MDV6328114.1 hypothetical protein [Idiomarina sp. Sol25]